MHIMPSATAIDPPVPENALTDGNRRAVPPTGAILSRTIHGIYVFARYGKRSEQRARERVRIRFLSHQLTRTNGQRYVLVFRASGENVASLGM
jgi:hypothetical protein